MKVSVCVELVYYYDAEIADDLEDYEIVDAADTEDPVFSDLCKVFNRNNINAEAAIVSIADEDGEILYEGGI